MLICRVYYMVSHGTAQLAMATALPGWGLSVWKGMFPGSTFLALASLGLCQNPWRSFLCYNCCFCKITAYQACMAAYSVISLPDTRELYLQVVIGFTTDCSKHCCVDVAIC